MGAENSRVCGLGNDPHDPKLAKIRRDMENKGSAIRAIEGELAAIEDQIRDKQGGTEDTEGDVVNLTEQLSRMEPELADMRVKLGASEARLTVMEDDKRQLLSQLEDQRRQLLEKLVLAEQQQQLEADCRATAKDNRRLRGKIDELEASVQEYKMAAMAAESVHAAASAREQVIAELQEKLAQASSAESSHGQTEALTQQLVDMETRFKVVEKERDNYLSKLEEAESQFLSDIVAQEESLKEKIDAQDAEIASLREQLEQSRAAQQDLEEEVLTRSQQIRAIRDHLGGELPLGLSMNDVDMSSIAVGVGNARVAELEEERDTLLQRCDALELKHQTAMDKRLARENKLLAELASKKASLERVNGELGHLAQKFAEQEDKHSRELEHLAAQNQRSIERLLQQNIRLEKDMQGLSNEMGNMPPQPQPKSNASPSGDGSEDHPAESESDTPSRQTSALDLENRMAELDRKLDSMFTTENESVQQQVSNLQEEMRRSAAFAAGGAGSTTPGNPTAKQHGLAVPKLDLSSLNPDDSSGRDDDDGDEEEEEEEEEDEDDDEEDGYTDDETY